jgi:hypothetical protein
MSDVPQVLLAHHLKALKLPTFLRDQHRAAAPAPPKAAKRLQAADHR